MTKQHTQYPSLFAIGDRVAHTIADPVLTSVVGLLDIGNVYGVRFIEGKVLYDIRTDDGRTLRDIDSCDVTALHAGTEPREAPASDYTSGDTAAEFKAQLTAGIQDAVSDLYDEFDLDAIVVVVVGGPAPAILSVHKAYEMVDNATLIGAMEAAKLTILGVPA